MRLLFVKDTLAWPRTSGHDVHTYHMMQACAQLGHEVAFAFNRPPGSAATSGLGLAAQFPLRGTDGEPGELPRGTWLQKRFRSFYGVPASALNALSSAVTAWRPDAAIIVGLDGLAYCPALAGPVRIWYAADEWVLHHLTQLEIGGAIRTHLGDALVKGVYERAHRHVVDRVWVVSRSEQLAMQWFAGMGRVDVLPNGVDGSYFHPDGEDPPSNTAVFWGRLDFGPNEQALEWFCRHVWPRVRALVHDARFTIVGFNASSLVRRLSSLPGISLETDLPDLRRTVRAHSLAVLPFVSGGGIKNKLLEAAALGLPIVCTRRATEGLRDRAAAPLSVTDDPATMADAIVELWSDAGLRRRRADAARAWVLKNHTWTATAAEAIASIDQSMAERCA